MRARLGSSETVLTDGFSKRDGGELLGRTRRNEWSCFPVLRR
jgi:hypothetical protein